MRYNNLKKLCIFSLLIFTTFSHPVFAQEFVRIENISGFNNISDNNSVSTADIDLDNDLDLFIVSKHKDKNGDEKTHSRLFRNDNNGKFTDITAASGLTNILPYDGIDNLELGIAGLEGYKYGSFWGDYNNDGYPDLFMTHHNQVNLYKNLGNNQFLEVTEAAGIVKYSQCSNTGATWFDYNNDGYLDLFINDWQGCKKNTFYENNGNGTFSDVSDKINHIPSDAFESYTLFPFDFNKDGWLDLYISNDLKKANGLYINNNGEGFTDEAVKYGLDSQLDDMAIVMNDYNLDGKFDFFISGINENVLYKNNGGNTFIDVTERSLILLPEERPWPGYWAWGSNMKDYDLDGDEDLIITNGSSLGESLPNLYYRNEHAQGLELFSNITDRINFGEASLSSEIISFDFDNDGDLDIFITNSFNKPYFFENKTNTKEKNTKNWLKISLEGTVSNRSAFGTEITIKTKTRTYKRYYNGVGFISQHIKPVHFGLNNETDIQEIAIKWPSGITETYTSFSANQYIKFTENNTYEILSIEPSLKIKGCTDPNSCTYNPLATENDGTCSYLSTSTIQGNTNSSFLKEEIYTYTGARNNAVHWSVNGGTIISGHSSNQIVVKWDLEKKGTVSVMESSNECNSKQTTLNIAISANSEAKNSSIARIWNEALLHAIRKDYARPTVHARNLFHFSIALYDAWSIFNPKSIPYLIGNNSNNFNSPFNGFPVKQDFTEDRKKAISYAAYRLLIHRFKNSPGAANSLHIFNLLMDEFGYDIDDVSTDYESGDAAALGNYIASEIIRYGLTDGANEQNDYANTVYTPVNDDLVLNQVQDKHLLKNPNRWQPLAFTKFIDQSGNVAKSIPDFLSPEWGDVKPFSLSNENLTLMERDGKTYKVYHLPETPPQLDTVHSNESSDLYKWNFALVSLWSSHLDPDDGVHIDISPASIGNIDVTELPNSYKEHLDFYQDQDGGDISKGRTINPVTNQAYKPQMVPKADYARVLAEFWADGPDSETPPGHWFTILNYVSDHPLLEKRFNGAGTILSDLEWDIKTYFILAGAMHDSAISAWSIKGWVDYIRPISAIRYMASLGQSSNKNLENYHPGGIPLMDGFIEIIDDNDPLKGIDNENVGKIKLKAWRGHNYIRDPKVDIAGVGWILASNWWPYQRPSFVTPPFAGFVSGHSTFSRAAAEVMTLLTGNEYFPGGIGEFKALKNEFLVFEKGPSVDVTLQWATYRDASDQTSLSRIWGGIHPPADDIPGRLIGEKVGIKAYNYALNYFNGKQYGEKGIIVAPNPITSKEIKIFNTNENDKFTLVSPTGKIIKTEKIRYIKANNSTILALPENLNSGIYFIQVNNTSKPIIVLK